MLIPTSLDVPSILRVPCHMTARDPLYKEHLQVGIRCQSSAPEHIKMTVLNIILSDNTAEHIPHGTIDIYIAARERAPVGRLTVSLEWHPYQRLA